MGLRRHDDVFPLLCYFVLLTQVPSIKYVGNLKGGSVKDNGNVPIDRVNKTIRGRGVSPNWGDKIANVR